MTENTTARAERDREQAIKDHGAQPIVAYAIHLDGALMLDYWGGDCAKWTRDPQQLGAMMVEAERICREVNELGTADGDIPELLTIVRATFAPEEWATLLRCNGAVVSDSDLACPTCGEADPARCECEGVMEAQIAADPKWQRQVDSELQDVAGAEDYSDADGGL